MRKLARVIMPVAELSHALHERGLTNVGELFRKALGETPDTIDTGKIVDLTKWLGEKATAEEVGNLLDQPSLPFGAEVRDLCQSEEHARKVVRSFEDWVVETLTPKPMPIAPAAARRARMTFNDIRVLTRVLLHEEAKKWLIHWLFC